MNYKPCSCCGRLTLEANSMYDVCPVCGWEDDPVQNHDPDFAGGANNFSLNESKKVFAAGIPLDGLPH